MRPVAPYQSHSVPVSYRYDFLRLVAQDAQLRCRLATILFCLVSTAAHAQSGDSPEAVHFPGVSIGGVPAGPEVPGWVYRPSGAGPFPAFVLARTCAGYIGQVNTWDRPMAKAFFDRLLH